MSSYKEFQFKSDVNKYIDCVWKDDSKSYSVNNNDSFLIVPDNTVELVFSSSIIERSLNGDIGKSCVVKSHLCGLKTIPQKIKLEGEVLLAVRFKPHGLFPFTKIDLNETINESHLLEDIFGSDILDLENKLFNTKNEDDQVELIENYFLKKLYKANLEKDDIFDFLISTIIFNKGIVNVKELCEKCNVSIKTIERKFLHKLGLSPKKYCRIVRIFYALKIPKTRNDVRLSSIALDHGFFDQAHFLKEVKCFTGMTPKDYFAIDRTIQTNIFMP